MFNLTASKIYDISLLVAISLLLIISVFILRSISPQIFPGQFIYMFLAVLLFLIFVRIDFDIYDTFSSHLYILSLIMLLTTLIIGQVTRGAVRWIPLGLVSIQPSEVMRPFLILFFAKYLNEKEISAKRFFKLLLIFAIPFFLILVQPSMGVAILTFVGFMGVLISSSIEKKYFLYSAAVFLLIIPFVWSILAPYQKLRITTFLDPEKDPLGSGYNSIQSMIAVGSGKITGRGWGEGIQTQLRFLPEKHTDFIFAAISEELGFLGSFLIVACLFVIYWILINFISRSVNPTARSFTTGIFLILLAQTIIHIGMNIGILPITGVPLPFISAGGSSLLGTSLSLAMVLNSKKD